MNYFALSAFVNIITSGVVGFFVLFRNYRSCVNRALFYYAFSIILWSGCYFFWQIATLENDALFWTKALMFFAIFIPSTFLQLSTALIGQSIQYRKQIFLSYAISVFFAVIDCSTNLIVKDVRSRMFFDYWPTAGGAYIPFLVFFFVIVIYAHILMYRRYKRLRGVERDKIKYVFLGTAIAFSGGSTNYFLWFDIPILPLGNVFVSVYVVLVAYAIVHHHLMDINIVFKRSLVYSILVTCITCLYLLFVLVSEHFLKNIFQYKDLVASLITAMITALAFIPLKNIIQNFVDAKFLKGRPMEIAERNALLMQEVADKEKFKAVATMASGMAHEIKNPLTAIKTFSEYLPLKMNDPEFLQKFSRIVGKEADRINELVHQLLEFSRPAPLKLEETPIQNLIEEVLDFLKSQFIN